MIKATVLFIGIMLCLTAVQIVSAECHIGYILQECSWSWWNDTTVSVYIADKHGTVYFDTVFDTTGNGCTTSQNFYLTDSDNAPFHAIIEFTGEGDGNEYVTIREGGPYGPWTTIMHINRNWGDLPEIHEFYFDCDGLVEPPEPVDWESCNADPASICSNHADNITLSSIYGDGVGYTIYWFGDESIVPTGNPADYEDDLIAQGSPVDIMPPSETSIFYAWAYDTALETWSIDACEVTITVYPSPDCTISGPAWVDEGIIDVVYSVEFYEDATYTWAVTNAIITDGNGTHEITIDVTGLEGEVIEIDVEVETVDECICTGYRVIDIGEPEPPPIPATGPFGIGLLLLALGGLMKFTKRI
jgi:hypothetical protein